MRSLSSDDINILRVILRYSSSIDKFGMRDSFDGIDYIKIQHNPITSLPKESKDTQTCNKKSSLEVPYLCRTLLQCAPAQDYNFA